MDYRFTPMHRTQDTNRHAYTAERKYISREEGNYLFLVSRSSVWSSKWGSPFYLSCKPNGAKECGMSSQIGCKVFAPLLRIFVFFLPPSGCQQQKFFTITILGIRVQQGCPALFWTYYAAEFILGMRSQLRPHATGLLHGGDLRSATSRLVV